jgi:hypothetical protein
VNAAIPCPVITVGRRRRLTLPRCRIDSTALRIMEDLVTGGNMIGKLSWIGYPQHYLVLLE